MVGYPWMLHRPYCISEEGAMACNTARCENWLMGCITEVVKCYLGIVIFLARVGQWLAPTNGYERVTRGVSSREL